MFFLESELYRAYLEARKHKRNTPNQLRFECHLEEEINALARDLENRTYSLLPSVCFINEYPVKREIIAADFRDRVVHHLLYSWIYPMFDRQFIYDSYSCRVGKGTLFGVQRAQGFLRAASDDFRRDCWVLRLDVSGFFMAIRREILYELVLKGLDKSHWKDIPNKDLSLFLLQKFIFSDPLQNARFRSPPEAWAGLPKNKSLRETSADCGLPIGNLTSQLFANIYMNPLDHFVKRDLKMQWYGRYVDDMLFVHPQKEFLLEVIESIRNFLSSQLKLELHPRKINIQPASQGFSFLGNHILPYRVYPGHRIVGNFCHCLHFPKTDPVLQENRRRSYLGYFSHCDAFRLTNRLCPYASRAECKMEAITV